MPTLYVQKKRFWTDKVGENDKFGLTPTEDQGIMTNRTGL